jgi:hypothetical protein
LQLRSTSLLGQVLSSFIFASLMFGFVTQVRAASVVLVMMLSTVVAVGQGNACKQLRTCQHHVWICGTGDTGEAPGRTSSTAEYSQCQLGASLLSSHT